MALSEGLKGFFKMFTDGFQNDGEYDDDPFTGLAGGYETDGQLALDTKESDLDAMYGTKVTGKTERSFGRESKVVSHPNSYKTGEITIIEPRSFSEAAQIVRKLLENKSIILNLDLLDKEQSQRTIDFVCGAAHAMGGTAQKISDMVFTFTPSNVSLSVENGAVQSKFAESLWNKPL